MKKVSLLLLTLVFSLNFFAQKKIKIKGDKNLTTVTNKIDNGFNQVEIDDALEVTINQGEENSYSLTTDNNLQDIIQFTVSDSILKIYTTNRITRSKKLEIGLTFINIEHITLKNNSRIEGDGRIESDAMYINTYNSSKFNLDIKADNIVVTMQEGGNGKLNTYSTSTTIVMDDKTKLKASVIAEKINVALTELAQLKLNGDSNSATFNLKDSSELNANKMKVTSAELNISNNSNAYVYAGKKLEIYAKGKSNIYVYGNPKIDIKELTDKSKIIKK